MFFTDVNNLLYSTDNGDEVFEKEDSLNNSVLNLSFCLNSMIKTIKPVIIRENRAKILID